MSLPSSDAPESMGKEDIIEFLGEDKPETIELPKEKEKPKEEEPEEEKELESEKEEEIDELEEIEKEIEEPKEEEELELVTPVRRKEILTKYPTLFKDFPYLERAYYREQKFTEYFPTIEDAKVAASKAVTLDNFEVDILSGNTEKLLQVVKAENPDGFNKIVDDYLPTLARIDEKAYHHVLGNTIRHTIMAMVREGKSSNNEALQSAAQILNQFVFGSSEFIPPTRLTKENPEKNNQENELKKQQHEFVRQRFETSKNDLNTKVNNVLQSTIQANIDPKQSMTEYVRKSATREAQEILTDLMNKDTRFRSLLDKLWEKAFEENFSHTSVDRIRSACLSKAKTLLPSVIKKARNDALKGLGKRVSDDKEETTEEITTKLKGEPRSEKKSGKIVKAEDIPKDMKTIDFLMAD